MSKSQTPHSLVFQGAGGHVAITVQPGATTTLELETREWDVGVQKFVGQLNHRPRWWARWWRRKRPTALPSPVFTILNKASPEQAGREHGLGTEEHRREQPASARHHGGHSEHAKGNHEAATFWQEVNEMGACRCSRR